MEQYELAVLYHPDLEIDLDKATAKVEKQIAASEGKVVKTDNWGKRKMAYTIAKQEHAVYVVYTLEMPTAGVKKLNDSLNITDEVIRFLITRPDLNKIAKAEALREEKAAKQAARGDQANDDDEKSDDDDEERPRRRRDRDDK
jgi:small subunit ribosomal protein S6